MTDHELLREYVERASQDAFAQLVGRHIDVIYASARRQVRDPQLADDVTQAVFIVLARKGRRLRGEGSLAGWLMKTTCFASRDVLRRERRRRRHEQAAARMAPTETPWNADDSLSPQLDRALARLGDQDRSALTLRYLQSLSVVEVAQAIGVSPDAASKRISRAVERLRRHLQLLPVAAPLDLLLRQLPHESAPASLASATTNLVAKGAASSSATAFSISKGVIRMIIWSKAKLAAIVITSILLLGAAGAGTFSLVRAQVGSAGSAQPDAPAADTGKWRDPFSTRAEFRDGFRVEFIGLCEHPSGGLQWWRADGTALPFAPYDHINGTLNVADTVVREIALRVTAPAGDLFEEADWDFPDAKGTTGTHNAGRDAANRAVGGVQAMLVALPDSPRGATFRMNIASGPWRVVATVPPGGAQSRLINGIGYRISAAKDVDGNTRYLYTRAGPLRPSLHERVVAIDTRGLANSAVFEPANGTIFTRSGELVVPLPLASIRELQFQQRPFERWVEIRNIALHPDAQTEVQVVTSDDEPAPNQASNPQRNRGSIQP